MTPRPPITPDYQFKSAPDIGEHVTQIAVDMRGEYAVFSNAHPLTVATKLREIAAHIEEMEADDE